MSDDVERIYDEMWRREWLKLQQRFAKQQPGRPLVCCGNCQHREQAPQCDCNGFDKWEARDIT